MVQIVELRSWKMCCYPDSASLNFHGNGALFIERWAQMLLSLLAEKFLVKKFFFICMEIASRPFYFKFVMTLKLQQDSP